MEILAAVYCYKKQGKYFYKLTHAFYQEKICHHFLNDFKEKGDGAIHKFQSRLIQGQKIECP